MNTRRRALAPLGLLLILSTPVVAQYRIATSTIGSGGGAHGGGDLSVHGTLGESCIGVLGGASYRQKVGFWYPSGLAASGVPGEFLPIRFAFGPCFPNPFRSTAAIRFALPREADVSLRLYDVRGSLVRHLLEERQPPGYHHLVFDAGDLASGIYFAQMRAKGFTKTRRLVLVK